MDFFKRNSFYINGNFCGHFKEKKKDEYGNIILKDVEIKHYLVNALHSSEEIFKLLELSIEDKIEEYENLTLQLKSDNTIIFKETD